jgi:hypothetical protein
MSDARSWRVLAGCLGAGAAMPVGPGRWHVLFSRRSRPLLVPAGELPTQRRCLRHFIGKPLQRRAAEMLLWLNARSPRAVLPELRCEPARDHAPSLLQAPSAAIQIGTPGPYQKASALLLTEPGRPFALAKIAMGRCADGAVRAEAEWLRTVAQVPEVDGLVPRLLDEGVTEGGRSYLVTSVAPSTATTGDFTPAHAHFLQALRHVRMRVSDFEQSGRAKELQDGLRELRPYIGHAARSLLQSALADCERPLLYWSGPYVASQGDFAPWNIRTLGERVFVFDWESGCYGASPLDDVLHFLLIDPAVHRRALGPRQMGQAMARARAFAAESYPQWDWSARVVAALSLAYLLGLVLRYSVPDRRISYRHPVIRSYLGLIRGRSQWMVS